MAYTTSSPMVTTIPITKARINLGAIVKRAHFNKEYFILEKDGSPIAGILDIDELEDWLELQDPKVREHIRKSNEEYLAGKSRPLAEFRAARRVHGQTKTRRRQKL